MPLLSDHSQMEFEQKGDTFKFINIGNGQKVREGVRWSIFLENRKKNTAPPSSAPSAPNFLVTLLFSLGPAPIFGDFGAFFLCPPHKKNYLCPPKYSILPLTHFLTIPIQEGLETRSISSLTLFERKWRRWRLRTKGATALAICRNFSL